MPRNNSGLRRTQRRFDAEIRQEERNERTDAEQKDLLVTRAGKATKELLRLETRPHTPPVVTDTPSARARKRNRK